MDDFERERIRARYLRAYAVINPGRAAPPVSYERGWWCFVRLDGSVERARHAEMLDVVERFERAANG